MAAIYCKYHPASAARWCCHQCKVDFCNSCAKPKSGARYVLCPVCQSPMQSLGMGNAITPFWLRLPKVFLYPIHIHSLIYMLALAGVSGVMGFESLFATLSQLAIFLASCRYAYAALEHSAQGHLKPPALSFDLLTGSLALPFKQLAVFFIMGVALMMAEWLAGPIATLVMLVMIIIWFPASVMELATSHSVGEAINPVQLSASIRAIGWPYALLFLFLFMLSTGNATLQNILLGHGNHPHFDLFLYSFISMYFMLAMFHLMGYVIYQYHEPLGYSVQVDAEQHQGGPAKFVAPPHPVIEQVAILLQEGKSEEARQLLKIKVAQERGDMVLRKQYQKLLLLAGDKAALEEHSLSYIGQLMADHKTVVAAEVLRDIQGLLPDFKLGNPDHVYPVMQALKTLREAKLAVKIAQNFHQRNAAHPDLPAIYLLTAKTLCEDLRQDAQAQKILRYLLAQFPQHPLHPEISVYLNTLQGLAKA